MKNEEKIGEGVGFERIRRITGYLAGGVEHFNNAKRAEVRDRVKHTLASPAGDAEREAIMPSIADIARNRALHALEQSFHLPDSKCMTFACDNIVFAKGEFDTDLLNHRLDVLRRIAANHNQMTNDQIEFWLDTIRYDGDIDLDMEKSPEQLGDTKAEQGLHEKMEQARQHAARQMERPKNTALEHVPECER